MKLEKILEESFGAKPDQMDDLFPIFSFPEWDSMSHMLFITRLESEYEIEVSGNEIAGIMTVGDIRKIILERGKSI